MTGCWGNVTDLLLVPVTAESVKAMETWGEWLGGGTCWNWGPGTGPGPSLVTKIDSHPRWWTTTHI